MAKIEAMIARKGAAELAGSYPRLLEQGDDVFSVDAMTDFDDVTRRQDYLCGRGSGTAPSTGNAKATACPDELVASMGGPRMPGTATCYENIPDACTQAVFTGDSKQGSDLSCKVVSSTGVFDCKPIISVSSSWMDLLTTCHGKLSS